MSSPSIRAGELNRQITIQARSATKDSFGQESTTWTDVITCFASISPLSGRELIAAQAQVAETTHEIQIRYRNWVTPANRVKYQGRVFNILNVLDEDMRHKSLRLLCSEGLNQG